MAEPTGADRDDPPAHDEPADGHDGDGHDGDGHDGDERTAAERLRELGGYIKEQRSRAQYSLRHLARIAGVSNPYLSQIERGLRNPSAEILQAIAKALQISAETLYVKAGLLDEPSDKPDLEVAILHEDSLTDRQRAALIEVYRSFRIENERAVDAHDTSDDGAGSDADPDDEEASAGGPSGDGHGTAAG